MRSTPHPSRSTTRAAAIEAEIREHRVVAILRLSNPQLAVDACHALVDGGLRIMEIAMTGTEALRALERAREALYEDVLLGAGTVLDAETVRRVSDAGASFCVSPNLDSAVVEAARSADLLMIPGVFSATEVVSAGGLGLHLLKLFPADPPGVAYLRALREPFPQVGFIPTGGVKVQTAAAWLSAGAVALGLGGGLVGRGDDPAAIRTRAQALLRGLVEVC